jgi:hypothetical protein
VSTLLRGQKSRKKGQIGQGGSAGTETFRLMKVETKVEKEKKK